MGKIGFFLLAISLSLLALFDSCDSHRLDEPLYYFKNETAVTIYLSEYTEINAGRLSRGKVYVSGEERIISGGGHFGQDSVIIYKRVLIESILITTDSIIYRNPKFGEDVSQGNHFFNPKRWLQLEDTKFVYAVQEADFD